MKLKALIVCSNYYNNIAKDLLSDAKTTLINSKLLHDTVYVPGVFEIPVVISKTTIDSIMKLSIESKKPIGNGILTCMNISQAQVRSDPLGKKRKGKEAAKAVLSILGFKI